MLGVKLCIMQL